VRVSTSIASGLSSDIIKKVSSRESGVRVLKTTCPLNVLTDSLRGRSDRVATARRSDRRASFNQKETIHETTTKLHQVVFVLLRADSWIAIAAERLLKKNTGLIPDVRLMA
jgi:hypothetical protein